MENLKASILSLRKRIAYWLYPVDVVALTREQMHGVNLDPKYIDDLPKDEREMHIANAHNMYSNPTFLFVIDHLIGEQADEIVRRSPNMDAILFGRGSINGQDLVKDEFERLSDLQKEIMLANKKENYDKFSVM